MIPALKSEFRKLFSVRSTYIILGIALVLELIFAFYVTGWRLGPEQLANVNFLSSQVTSAINILSLLAALISVLLVTHEYRYNTINYALTSSNSRSRVFFAKFLAMSGFVIVFTVIFAALSPLLSLLAVHIRDLPMGHQVFSTSSLLWRVVLAGWGFAVFAFIMASLIRIQVGAIVALFFVPSTVESLLGLLLKKNQVYLPFSALNMLLDVESNGAHISYARAAVVSGAYMLVGLVIAWLVFLRRDAS